MMIDDYYDYICSLITTIVKDAYNLHCLILLLT